jgi:hypothetical protein
MVASRLNRAQREVRELIVADRFQATVLLAEQLKQELGDGARTVRLQTDVVQFERSCAFLAELARQAVKQSPP